MRKFVKARSAMQQKSVEKAIAEPKGQSYRKPKRLSM
jgi:hypothetical protein